MELLERDEYLELLRSRFRKASLGEGNSVFVMGEAGIGKSTLVKTFLKETDGKAEVFTALCDSLFTPRPLGVLYDLAAQIGKAIFKETNPGSQRTAIFGDFLQLITQYGKPGQPGHTRGPIVLVIEDIHWADEASLDFIKFLARRISDAHCLFILTFRDNEISLQHPLRNVLGELPTETFSRVVLHPLSREAVKTLATGKSRKGEDLYEMTGGNPFYVTELLANYRTEIPDSIRDAILVLYNRCSDQAMLIWELLAVMPEGLELQLLQKFDEDWHHDLESFIFQKILVFKNDRLVFKHELFRRTVESFLSPFKRIEIHNKVLELFQDFFIRHDMFERMIHYAKNGSRYELVARHAPPAARQAAALGSHIEATKLYLAAIDYHTDASDEQLVEYLEAYSYECYLTNQIKEAIIYQSKAFSIWKKIGNQEQEANSLRFLSRLWWYGGDRKEAETYAHQAIERFENLPASKAKAMAYSNLSQLRMLADDVEAAVLWGNKAIALAKEIGDEEIRCHALNNIGTVRLKRASESKLGEEQLEESLQIALDNSFHEHAARAYTNIISFDVLNKNYSKAQRYFEDAIQYCGPLDLHSWTWYMLACKVKMMMEKGEWEGAEAISTKQLSAPSHPAIARLTALTVRATIALRRGNENAKQLLLEAKDIAFLLHEHQRIIPIVIACLEYEWVHGTSVLTEYEIASVVNLIKSVDNIWLNSEADFWLKKVRAIHVTLREKYEPYDLLQKGKVAAAAQLWKKIGCPYEAAITLSSGDADQRVESLHILQTLGANAIHQKLSSEMRAAGIRKIPRGLRKSTLSNSAQLTTRELDILHLLQKGASNKEIAGDLFISPKTVDHHISSILFKLDVPSRTKAVGEATKLGILK